MLPRQLRPPLLPYTTRFRSETNAGAITCDLVVNCAGQWARQVGALAGVLVPLQSVKHQYIVTEPIEGVTPRSEEHTSELQSREKLVCRLLLEKKKQKNSNNT